MSEEFCTFAWNKKYMGIMATTLSDWTEGVAEALRMEDIRGRYDVVCGVMERLRSVIERTMPMELVENHLGRRESREKVVEETDYAYYRENIYDETRFRRHRANECMVFLSLHGEQLKEFAKDGETERAERKRKLRQYAGRSETEFVEEMGVVTWVMKDGVTMIASVEKPKEFPDWIYLEGAPYAEYDKLVGSFEFALCSVAKKVCGDETSAKDIVKATYLCLALKNEVKRIKAKAYILGVDLMDQTSEEALKKRLTRFFARKSDMDDFLRMAKGVKSVTKVARIYFQCNGVHIEAETRGELMDILQGLNVIPLKTSPNTFRQNFKD